MLKEATEQLDEEEGVYIRYGMDGSLFNLRRLHAHSKTMEKLIRELLFADDAALVALSEASLQRITSCFAAASRMFGLEVSLKKTEVLYQPSPQVLNRPPNICIGDTALKNANEFNYLGCIISNDAKIDKEIDNRLAKANSSFGRLHKRVWNNKQLRYCTKIRVYRAVVLTTLLYGSESWVAYRHHVRLLERFHQRCLRSILNIHWRDYITNVEVLDRAKIPSIEAILLKQQLRWAGHVHRMNDNRFPKLTLYGELSRGHRVRGAPRKRFKDSLKKSLACASIDHNHWSDLAADRKLWRNAIHEGASNFETNRKALVKDKRQRRKARISSNTLPDTIFPCRLCSRSCLSRIGLLSHERSCIKKRGQNPS